jgi:hypothetical protein
VTSAKLPARLCTIRCAAVAILPSSPSIAKSFIVNSRLQLATADVCDEPGAQARRLPGHRPRDPRDHRARRRAGAQPRRCLRTLNESVRDAGLGERGKDAPCKDREMFATNPALKRVVCLAIDRAIREIIAPVVERSVTIAGISTRAGRFWSAAETVSADAQRVSTRCRSRGERKRRTCRLWQRARGRCSPRSAGCRLAGRSRTCTSYARLQPVLERSRDGVCGRSTSQYEMPVSGREEKTHLARTDSRNTRSVPALATRPRALLTTLCRLPARRAKPDV